MAKDISGQRFGRLVALRPTEERKRGQVVWECQCDCGNTAYVQSGNLVGGNTRSCGCLRKEQAAEAMTALTSKPQDLSNRRFGRLTALRAIDERYDGAVVWECQCDCGAAALVRQYSLLSGDTQSCGCLFKEVSKQMMDELQNELGLTDGTSISKISNKRNNKNNTTGCKGVSLWRGRYQAYITFKRKRYFLGLYTKMEDAVKARKKAEAVLHDETTEYYTRWTERTNADPDWAGKHPIQIHVIQNSAHDFKISFEPEL